MKLQIPEHLPISAKVPAISEALERHQVLIVAGETGSGKTTQLPRIALACGRGADAMIGHTQPRRIAARTLAARIADECGVELGAEVGFSVRFTDRTDRRTRVRVMTDGILLAELQRDRDLRKYDTLIIDEAHERSLNIDFLLGYLHTLLPRRPDLRVVVTSATIDVERFSAHFDGAPVIEVTGRTYPVEVRYQPTEGVASDDVDAVCEGVLDCLTSGDGDVLVFLSGQREIQDVADALRTQLDVRTHVLPLYSRLSVAEQARVFAPGGGRRVVLATNVAETSLTVPGIRYVVDPGTARISRYSHRLKVQRLPIEAISQASANQRAGRCGRVRDGVAIRLYSESDFQARPEFTDPEILRTNLASVLLQMAALRLGDVTRFPFLDPPDTRQIRDGMLLLHELGAVHSAQGSAKLTPLGKKLARLPLDPRIARMVLAAAESGCVREVVIIAAGLTIVDPRERPVEERGRADASHARYVDRTSDFLTLLRLWDHLDDQRRNGSSSGFRRACREQYLNYLRVREWQDLVSQLRDVTAALGFSWSSTREDSDAIHRALLTGLLSQVGMRDDLRRDYLGARGARFVLFPGSALGRSAPDWVMSSELVETSRLFARRNAVIKPEWIEQAAEHLLVRQHSEPRWSAKRGATVASERVTLFGIPISVDRVVDFGRISPHVARELFIRAALIQGEWRTRHAFWHENVRKLKHAAELEERSRRQRLALDDEAIFSFYDARIPAEVTSVRHFDSWWKKASVGSPDLLSISEDLLLTDVESGLDDSEFPIRWSAGPDLALSLSYAFAPGAAEDGVTVEVPLPALFELDPREIPGAVPGRRAELIMALVRSPRKEIRRGLGPAPNVVPEVLSAPELLKSPLLEGVADALTRISGIRFEVADFDLNRVPLHLLPRYQVIDEYGAILGTGRDLGALQRDLGAARAALIARAAHDLNHVGATEWDFGEIPMSVQREVAGVQITGYPALVDRGSTVDLQVLSDQRESTRKSVRGVTRLLALGLPDPGPRGFAGLDTPSKLALGRYPHGGSSTLLADLRDAVVTHLINGRVIRDRSDFDATKDEMRVRLPRPYGIALSQLVGVLEIAWQAESNLSMISSTTLSESLADAHAELARLLGPRPISRIGVDRLTDLRRYCAALNWRVQKMNDDAARDLAVLSEVRFAEEILREVITDWPVDDQVGASEVSQQARRMLDEFRVSAYAQQIRASIPISLKRIEKFAISVTSG